MFKSNIYYQFLAICNRIFGKFNYLISKTSFVVSVRMYDQIHTSRINVFDRFYDFAKTNVDLVLNKMPYASNCIIKKGFFPDTAIDVNDCFCFVSIDTDLFAPIYSGLKYFYPKLSEGGYIFIHDFNNKGYLGAREAVMQFCSETNAKYFPLCDGGGTCVIVK